MIPITMPEVAMHSPVTSVGRSLISCLAEAPRQIAMGPRIKPTTKRPTQTSDAMALALVVARGAGWLPMGTVALCLVGGVDMIFAR